MTAPFAMGGVSQPNITPKTTQGGGAALPPYLQMRKPVGPGMTPSYSGQQTQPVVTPKSTAVPGEVTAGQPPRPSVQPPVGQPPITPKPGVNPTFQGTQPVAPAQAGGGLTPGGKPGGNLNDVYQFFKSDLENQRNQALAGTRADASARGVFYGTPLTGSEADINTQYLRGLGQMQSGMYGNEQQNQLARLGLAESLGWQGGMNQPPVGNGLDFSGLGALFAPNAATAGNRAGPGITPKSNPGQGQTTGMDPITGQPVRY